MLWLCQVDIKQRRKKIANHFCLSLSPNLGVCTTNLHTHEMWNFCILFDGDSDMPKKERHLFRLVFRLFYRNVSFGPFLNTHVTTRQFVFLFNGRRHVCVNRAIGGTQTFSLTCWILEPDCIHIFLLCAF